MKRFSILFIITSFTFATTINVPADYSTIQAGITAANHGDTILVANGTYIGGINFNGKGISIIGQNKYSTIIEGLDSCVVMMRPVNNHATLSDFTIKNGIVYGGIQANRNVTLKNLIVSNNSADNNGAGIQINAGSSIATIENVQVNNNTSYGDGGGIYINTNQGGSVILKNVTISENSAQLGGSGIQCEAATNLTLINCILWNNEINFSPNNIPSSISISYSNIEGGIDSILTNNNGSVDWGDGNINLDPLFCNPDSSDFSLSENSPCIGIGENGLNIGAFGIGCGIFNFPPSGFSLLGVQNNASIQINESNINDGFISFWWENISSDENGDSLYYLFRSRSSEIDDYSINTNNSSVDLFYSDIIENMSLNNVTTVTIEWTVYVTDGIDSVEADNAPYTLQIDGANALITDLERLIPLKFVIYQNYPNPFNPKTSLRYDLPENNLVNIIIYDMMGREVKTLVKQAQEPGYKSVIWDATNDYGKPVSAGIYLYQIQAGKYISTKKMVLLK